MVRLLILILTLQYIASLYIIILRIKGSKNLIGQKILNISTSDKYLNILSFSILTPLYIMSYCSFLKIDYFIMLLFSSLQLLTNIFLPSCINEEGIMYSGRPYLWKHLLNYEFDDAKRAYLTFLIKNGKTQKLTIIFSKKDCEKIQSIIKTKENMSV